MAMGPFARIVATIFSAVSINCGGSTTRLTRPMRKASSEGEAVDGRDDRFGAALDPVEDLLAVLGERLPPRRVETGQFLDVGPGDESLLTRAGDDHRASGAVRCEIEHGMSDLCQQAA